MSLDGLWSILKPEPGFAGSSDGRPYWSALLLAIGIVLTIYVHIVKQLKM